MKNRYAHKRHNALFLADDVSEVCPFNRDMISVNARLFFLESVW